MLADITALLETYAAIPSDHGADRRNDVLLHHSAPLYSGRRSRARRGLPTMKPHLKIRVEKWSDGEMENVVELEVQADRSAAQRAFARILANLGIIRPRKETK